MRFRAGRTGPNPLLNNVPTDRSKAVLLLQFFFICASVVSYMVFVLSLFVHHLSFFWWLGKAVLRICGIISRVASLEFFLRLKSDMQMYILLTSYLFFKKRLCTNSTVMRPTILCNSTRLKLYAEETNLLFLIGFA